MNTLSKGPWHNEFICYDCKKSMSYNTKMYSHGICPNCGYNSHGTICACDILVVRKVWKKWWKFWDFEYEKKENH